jgi:O-antigen ligase
MLRAATTPAILLRIHEAFLPERAAWTLLLCALASLIFSIAIAQSAVLLSVIVWGVRSARRRSLGFHMDAIAWAFVTSVHVSESARILRTEIPFMLFFFVARAELEHATHARVVALLRVLFWSAAAATLVALAKFGIDHVPRISSTTAGFYTLGGYLCAVLAVALAAGHQREVHGPRWLWISVCVFVLVGILMTQNRLHWVTAGLVLAAVGLARERWLLAVGLLAAVGAFLLSSELAERMNALVNLSGNMSGRDVIWRGARMLAFERPFAGFGPQTFREVFPLLDIMPDKGVASWHNDYLQVYMDSGLLGAIPFVAVVLLSLRRVLITARRIGLAHPLARLNAAAGAGLVVFALAGGMLDALLSMLYRVLLAFAIALPAIATNALRATSPTPGKGSA